MGTIKKVAKLLVVGAVLGMTLMLVACGSSNAGRGISASHPETAMDEAFSRYLNGEDYMQIFAADVEKSQVDRALEAWKNDGAQASLSSDGRQAYWDLRGEEPKLGKNEELFAIYSIGGSLWSQGLKGYVIIREDTKADTYYIVDFDYWGAGQPSPRPER